MGRGLLKAERLMEMERLYLQRPFSDIELAARLGVSRQTVFRDRQELTTRVFLVEVEPGSYKIDRVSYLSNIRVDLNEALALYLAARRTSQQTRLAYSKTASALEKLALALKQPMTEKLVKAAEVILSQQSQPEREAILNLVAHAWVDGRKIRFTYQGLQARRSREFVVSPYLIEPSPWSDGVYLIGYSNVHKAVATFKVERIERASLTTEPCTLPPDFDEGELLKHAWGIWGGEGEPELVRLRFAPGRATRRLKESIWHPLEKVADTEDGGCTWEAPIAEWREMLPWIRGWGADVEVLEPEGLRKALERETRRLAEVYGIQSQSYDELIAHWRKRDEQAQSLTSHLTEASELAERFATKVGLPEVGKILGLLHDFGKASDEYQKYLRSGEGLINPDEDEYVDYKAKRGKIDHSTAGAQLVYQKLSSRGPQGKYLAQVLALALASHHSGLIDCLTPAGENNFKRRIYKKDEDTHFTEVQRKLLVIEQKLDSILIQPIEQRFWEKLAGMKDANEAQATLPFKHGLLARFLLSCLLDADRLNTADFEFPENEILRNYGNYHPWSMLVERLEEKFDEFARKIAQMEAGKAYEVNQLRTQVAQACLDFAAKPKGIYQLTVPTGGGKTLSSLRFALHHAAEHDMDRVIYVIPYISIIDQNAEEARKVLEDKDEQGKVLNNVVLEHHSNLTPEEETRRHNLLAENWDAPVVFTTQVQFLEALFGAGTRNTRRMHQLANAVIVFDEVQTIPINIVHMFNTALRFLTHDCSSTIMLCTATQPPLDKLPDNPYRALTIHPEQKIIQNEKELFEKLKRVEVHDKRKPGSWSDPEVADLAERALQEKGSVLVVVNTKASAQSLYKEIQARNLAAKIYHLSTNMCPAHRLNVLDDVKEKLKNHELAICVSTQLVEAGVDIDFGAVIRYLAGLDSIAQAAGRCNRHGEREGLGSVWVVNPKEENIDRLKDIIVGREKAQTVLDDFRDHPETFENDRIGLNAIAAYYKHYYGIRRDDMVYKVGANSSVGRDDDLFNLLSMNTLSVQAYQRINQADPDIAFRQSFQSASRSFQVINSPTRGVVVPYREGDELIKDLCSANELEKQFKLLKKAQRYSVNLFTYDFDKLVKQKSSKVLC